MALVDEDVAIAWNSTYRIEVIESESAVYLFSEYSKKKLKGEAYLCLAHFLQEGKHSAEEIVECLSDRVSAKTVYFMLCELEANHLIQSFSSNLSKSIVSYCGFLNVDAHTALERLKVEKIYVQDFGYAMKQELIDLLQDLSIQVVDDVNDASKAIAFVEDYLEIKNMGFPSCPSLLVKPFGALLWVGPVIGKDHPSCHECMLERIQLNRLGEHYVGQKKEVQNLFPPMTSTLKTTKQIALSVVAHELFKWIVTEKNELLNHNIVTFDTLSLKTGEHQVPKKATCRHFRTIVKKKSAEIILTHRKNEKNSRCMTPEQTLNKYLHHVSSITGLVGDLIPCKKDFGPNFHVYFSGMNWALDRASQGKSMITFRSAASGKGITEVIAKAGSLCEALERISVRFQGDESSIYASYRELGPRAIHPNRLSLYSLDQYKNRECINQSAHQFHKIGNIFPEEEKIGWTSVWSLTEQCEKFVPTSYCYFGYKSPQPEWKSRSDSNGCAAGNFLEEAILQGFCELVERDSVAIWWYNRLNYPQIDLESFNHPYINLMIEEYGHYDRELYVLDITADLEIPCCVAISRFRSGPSEKIIMGFGCHLDIEMALLRAVTEMNQFFVQSYFWERTELSDDPQEKNDQSLVLQWMEAATVENQPYLQPKGMRKASDYQKWTSQDLLEDIVRCRQSVESQGYECLVLDNTREEIGLNVVRVMVPGLRHLWPRFAPGRLYEVPVKMGKLKAPLSECELNPIPMFL